MKSLILLFLISFYQTSFAGEFNKIDLAVREEITNHYSQDIDNNQLQVAIDIWGLNVDENYDNKNCLIIVSGNVKKTSASEILFYRFWVCLTKDSDGEYFTEFLKDVTLTNE